MKKVIQVVLTVLGVGLFSGLVLMLDNFIGFRFGWSLSQCFLFACIVWHSEAFHKWIFNK